MHAYTYLYATIQDLGGITEIINIVLLLHKYI